MIEETDFEEVHAERAASQRESWHPPGAGGGGDLGRELFLKQEENRARAEKDQKRREKALAGEYGPVTKVAAEAGLSGLGSIVSLDRVTKKLHQAGQLLRDLPPELWDDAHQYLRAQASRSLRAAWGDWRIVNSFLDNHFPSPMGGHAPYGPDGVLRSEDISEMDLSTPFLVDGVIPTAQVGIVTARYGLGKTFLATGLGLGIAFGEPWLGLDVVETGPVRFVLAEGRASHPKRIAGWLVDGGYLPESFTREELAEALEGRAALQAGILRLDDPQLERVLLRTVESEGTRLLVLDTLGRLLGAEQSDSDNDTANRVMGILSRVASETGVTILLVHHPGHSNTDRARGASAWEQAADFVFGVSKGTKDDVQKGRTIPLKNRKQRDAKRADPIGYRLRTVTMECDAEPWETAVVECGEIEEETPLPLRIREVVRSNPGESLRFIRDVVSGRSKEIGAAVSQLIAGGYLEDKGKGPGYSLHLAGEWAQPFEADPDEAPDLSDVTGEGAERE